MQENYYNSIDEFLLFNWFKCNDGDYTFTRLDKKVGDTENDSIAWETIYNDFIQKIGLDPKFKKYIDLVEYRMQLCLKFLNSLKDGKRNRALINEINQVNIKIESFEKQGTDSKTSKSSILNTLSKQEGYRINPKEITVADYFALINDYGKAN